MCIRDRDTGSDNEEAASQEETETVPVETEIVEPETAESETEEAETEEPEETESEFQDGLSESEFDAALEESETENTTDAESGLTLSDVLEQAGEQDIDLIAMEDGETVSFTAVNTSTRATQDVDVTRGTAYYYADYGLGSYVTYKYTVKFGNVSATAYCVQPSKAGPGDGVYTVSYTHLEGNSVRDHGRRSQHSETARDTAGRVVSADLPDGRTRQRFRL